VLYFLLVIFVLLLPFSFRLAAKGERDDLIIQAEFMLLNKIPIRILNKSIAVKSIVSSALSRKKSKNNRARIFNSVREHVTIETLKIDTAIGTGDAASTAIISGQAFGIAAPLVLNLAKKDYSINVNPVYDRKQFEVFAECILNTNLANTFIALFEILRGRKNGKASN